MVYKHLFDLKMSKRDIARQLLKAHRLDVTWENIIFQSGEPYEDTIRKVLRGVTLDEALGTIADSVEPCKRCNSLKVKENSVQTRSADESATHFYYCTKCSYSWKV
jgi:DNA-directed RNA polymerase subunit M/transcription elongation factor TFIIS